MRLGAAFAALVLIFVHGPTPAKGASFTLLGGLPGEDGDSRVSRISADGSTVVGSTRGEVAFRWTSTDGLVALGRLPGTLGARAFAVSHDGSVIVGSSFSETEEIPFVWRGETNEMVALGDGSVRGVAHHVSSDGRTIAGTLNTPDGDTSGFRWTEDSGLEDLGALMPIGFSHGGPLADNGATVFGIASDDRGPIYRRDGKPVGRLPLPTTIRAGGASAVTPDGSIAVGVGARSDTDFAFDALVWRGATVERLGHLDGGADYSVAYDVSDDGSVIVGESENAQGPRAFIWTKEDGMQPLAVLFEDLGIDLDGWVLSNAGGLSGDGRTIAGTAWHPIRRIESGFVAVIPEPSTATLLAVGLAGLALARRR